MTEGKIANPYASAALPESETVPGWRVALINMSFTFALSGFLNCAQIGLAIGFWPSVLAALITGLLMCVGASLTAVVSVRSRLTTYLLVQHSFGVRGAAIVNVVIAVVHYCWFGVNVSFLGDAMVAAANEGYGLPGNFAIFVVAGSILITASTIFGFRTLDRLAMVAVPLVGLILVAVCIKAMSAGPVDLGPAANPPVPMNFGIALTSLIGSFALVIATMPDLSRFISTERGAVVGMALSFPFGIPVLMVVSVLIALATSQTDIMQLVVSYGFGAPALILLLLSVWTINALNLYSAGLSMAATFPTVRPAYFTIAGGVVGCLFALLGIIDAFIPFLVALGLLIPPIAAIYIIDGFIVFRETGYVTFPGFRWPAIIVWLGSLLITGPAVAMGWSLTTVPAIDAALIAAAGYLLVLRFVPREALARQ